MTTINTNPVAQHLNILLADSYSLYLQTQNYHWNVRGPLFFSLHQMFEEQYTQLAAFVDEVAERIRALGLPAPATFQEFSDLSTLPKEQPVIGSPALKAEVMVRNLLANQQQIIRHANTGLAIAETAGDVGSVDTFTQTINMLEKSSWMLRTVIED